MSLESPIPLCGCCPCRWLPAFNLRNLRRAFDLRIRVPPPIRCLVLPAPACLAARSGSPFGARAVRDSDADSGRMRRNGFAAGRPSRRLPGDGVLVVKDLGYELASAGRARLLED